MNFSNPTSLPSIIVQYGYSPWGTQYRPPYLPAVGEEDVTQGTPNPCNYEESDMAGHYPEKTLSPGEMQYCPTNNVPSEYNSRTNYNTAEGLNCYQYDHMTKSPKFSTVPSSDHSSENAFCNGDVGQRDFNLAAKQINIHIAPTGYTQTELQNVSPAGSPQAPDGIQNSLSHRYSPLPKDPSVTPTSSSGKLSPISMVTVMSSSSTGRIPTLVSVQQQPLALSIAEGLECSILN